MKRSPVSLIVVQGGSRSAEYVDLVANRRFLTSRGTVCAHRSLVVDDITHT